MVRRYVVLSVVVASIVAGLALKTKPLQAAAASLGGSWNATQRWVSSLGSKTIRPTERVAALLRPQLPEQQGGGQTGPTVTTNKADYAPFEVVEITGSGFVGDEEVTLQVTHLTGAAEGGEGHEPWTVFATNGTFTATWTVPPDDSIGATMMLTADGITSHLHAETTFTDDAPASGDLDQCRNGTATSPANCVDAGADPNTDNGTGWVNGNAGAQTAHYLEGDSIPYRLRLSGLEPGPAIHTVTIEWDTLKNGNHALDYITTYNRTETNADPCSGVVGCSGSPHQLEIPLDPNLNGAGKFPGLDGTIGTADDLTLPLASGLMSLWGGTIQSISTPTTVAGADVPTQITISFITSVSDPVLAWGGHIATRLDWGADNSAIAITGSPFHTHFVDLDGKGGNQDRSLSAAAVFFPVLLTIVKETNPDNAPSTQFNYTTSGQFAATANAIPLTNPSFSLTPPNGTTSVSKVYYLQSTASRSITESDPSPNFALTNLSCTHDDGGLGIGSDSVNARTVTLTPKEGESITCTFVNAQQTGSIAVKKVTVPAGSAQSFGFTRNFGLSPFSLIDGGTDTVGSLTPGNTYSVAEDEVAGWTLTSSTCTRTPGDVAAGTISAIVVVAGQTTTCTFTNTRDQGYLKLTKSFDAKTSGFAGTFAVVYNCGAGDVTVNLAAGASHTAGPFDTGTSCTVTEPTLPTAPAGWTFGTPSIATSPATIVKGDQAAAVTVTVTNTITRDQGYLKIRKYFNAQTSGFAGTFAVIYNCGGAGNVTVNLAAGASSTVGPFDTGTSCTVTEPTLPTNPTGWTFGTPSITGSPATIVKGDQAAAVTVTVTNSITRDLGNLKIIKSVVGAPALFTGSFSVDVSCGAGGTFNDQIISYPNPGFVTISNIPTGNTCTVTEDTPTGAPTGYSWGTVVVSGTATIAKNTTSEVTVTNTVTGRAKVVKTKAGGALAAGDSFTFQIRTGASTLALGDIQETGYATQANGGVINFSYVLVPGNHYQLCELVMPGWNTNLTGTLFVPGSVIPPALPNPNVDNSPVCRDFTAQAGVTTTFNVDNTFPGGLARTIGFWKNWASCNASNGKQKPVLDQTLASAQTLDGLVVSAQSGTYPAFTPMIYLRLTDTNASPDIATDCAKAVALLNKSTIGGGNKKMASDPAFNLAAQLVAAELNFFAGAAKNGAVITAVNQAVVLLGKYKFDGNGYTPKLTNADANAMNNLATTLDNYNNNRP